MGFISKQFQSYGANSQGKAYIKFHFECDSQSDLPTQTQFESSDNLIVAMGSTAHTIVDNRRWEMNSTGTWVDITSSSGGGGSYTLPPATTSTLGGVIVGSGLTVASDGTLSTAGGGGGSVYNNHNSGFRGNNLGTSYTAAQKDAVYAGTFDDLYVGDYWYINNVNWRIVDIDCFMGFANPATTKHHLVIMPDESLATATFGGGYYHQAQLKSIVENQVISTINSAFGSTNILEHTEALFYYDNYQMDAVSICVPSINNIMGNSVLDPAIMHPAAFSHQFALFRYKPEFAVCKESGAYWLQDANISNAYAGIINSYGIPSWSANSATRYIRPYFLLKG